MDAGTVLTLVGFGVVALGLVAIGLALACLRLCNQAVVEAEERAREARCKLRQLMGQDD